MENKKEKRSPGRPLSGKNPKAFTAMLPEELFYKMEEWRARRNWSRREFLEIAVSVFLDNKD